MRPAETEIAIDPHAEQPVVAIGPKPEDSDLVLVFLHGRGASAESILSLYHALSPGKAAAFAPQASGSSWYPASFLAPIQSNQPYLNSALLKVESIVSEILERGVPAERIAIIGFSQGACLTMEYGARHPRPYGALIGFTGGLIGPPGTERDYAGSLEGAAVFLGAGDPDPHVPFSRVIETREILESMGAAVELRRYPGIGHTIIEEELDASRELLIKASNKV